MTQSKKLVSLQIGTLQFLEALNAIQNFWEYWLWLQISRINKLLVGISSIGHFTGLTSQALKD